MVGREKREMREKDVRKTEREREVKGASVCVRKRGGSREREKGDERWVKGYEKNRG